MEVLYEANKDWFVPLTNKDIMRYKKVANNLILSQSIGYSIDDLKGEIESYYNNIRVESVFQTEHDYKDRKVVDVILKYQEV